MRTWLIISIALIVVCILFYRYIKSEAGQDSLSNLDLIFVLLMAATAVDWGLLLATALVRGLF